jgi:uncharacterized delta-60 repeat protein
VLITVGAHPVVAAEGDLDTSFGAGGKTTTAILSQNDFASSAAIQSDGKIVVAGTVKSGSRNVFALVRYKADGTLDTSFDSNGKVLTDVGTGDAYCNSVAIQPDGRIVVAGYARNGSNDDIALVRYKADGSLDTNFGSGGTVLTDIDGDNTEAAYSVAIQSDGKIVAAGSHSVGNNNNDFALVRYDTNGNLDTSFGSDGKVTTAISSGVGDDYVYSVVIQPDGKIVVAGQATGSNFDFALARYNTDGALDTNFDSDGKVITAIGSSIDAAYSVAIQSDGKIVAAGASVDNKEDFALVRYNANGSLDTDFGTGGKVTTDIGSDDDLANSVAIQADGKILAAGYSYGNNNDFALARYNADGTLDTNFGADGKVTTAIGGTDVGVSVAIQSDGNIVLAGHSDNGSNYDFAVARYVGTPPAPSVPIPALPTILLMVLSGLLALFGFYRIRASK